MIALSDEEAGKIRAALEYYAVALPRHKEIAVHALLVLSKPEPRAITDNSVATAEKNIITQSDIEDMMLDLVVMRPAEEWAEELAKTTNFGNACSWEGVVRNIQADALASRPDVAPAHAHTKEQLTSFAEQHVAPTMMPDALTINAMRNAFRAASQDHDKHWSPDGKDGFTVGMEHALSCDAFRKWMGGVGERTWQPIDTAPKDGTDILLYYGRANVFKHEEDQPFPLDEELPCFQVDIGAYYSFRSRPGNEHGEQGWTANDSHVVALAWQPLPAPPVLANIKTEG